MVQNYGHLQGVDKSAQLSGRACAMPPAKRQRAQGDLNATTLMFQTIDAVIVSLPNRPLDAAKLPMTVDLGGSPVVLETDPGNSATDLIVRAHDQNIVFTGDLLFNRFYPVTFDANFSLWRATLGKFASFSKGTLFVPGHRPICGQEGMAAFRAVFNDLAEHAGKAGRRSVKALRGSRRVQGFPDFCVVVLHYTDDDEVVRGI